MAERHPRGVLDTSVLVDLERLAQDALPVHAAITAITLAELAAGLHTTSDPRERGARLARLQAVEASFDSLPFDADAARRYGHLVSLVVEAGQKHRPRRLDLMIAATAQASELPLYTRNPKDLRALARAMTIVAV
jgi:toxin FitB